MKLTTAGLVTGLIFSGISIAQAEDLSFMLTNETDANVSEFYVSHTGSNQWEENLIEGAILPSGNEVPVNIVDGRTTCTYDIKVVFDDGDVIEDYELDLCEMGGYVISAE